MKVFVYGINPVIISEIEEEDRFVRTSTTMTSPIRRSSKSKKRSKNSIKAGFKKLGLHKPLPNFNFAQFESTPEVEQEFCIQFTASGEP